MKLLYDWLRYFDRTSYKGIRVQAIKKLVRRKMLDMKMFDAVFFIKEKTNYRNWYLVDNGNINKNIWWIYEIYILLHY